MANTYTQLYIHLIFAVSNRMGLLDEAWREKLYHYISAALCDRGHAVMAINGTGDHIHLLLGLNPSESVAALVQSLKIQSSRWINRNYFPKGNFGWQSGYAAFSYSRSQIPNVVAYIRNQEKHHAKRCFMEEYRYILEQSGIDYRPEFIFTDIYKDMVE